MKRTIGVIIAFVMFVAGAMLLTGCGNKKVVEQPQPVQMTETVTTTPTVEEPQISKPWIQVIAGGVYLTATNTPSTTLLTGDELNEGAQVETNETGLANIVFPDGSVARLDSNTRVVISVGSYNETNKTLSVRLKLAAGNMWSKIIKLATPESFWEVQTSNAVAAVRGTAFGVSFAKDATTIIGSEHQVTVRALNPATGEAIIGQEAVVGEGKYVVVAAADIEALTKKTAKLADWVRVSPKKLLEQAWIIRAIEADLKITNQLKSAESLGLTEVQSQELYVETINEEKNSSQNTNTVTTTQDTAATTTVSATNAVDASGASTDTSSSATHATTASSTGTTNIATSTITVKPLTTVSARTLTTLSSSSSATAATVVK
ncbi:MAG: FecR domain-containing protein [Patescibacteria group bacterium]